MTLADHLKRLWGIRHIRAALFCYRVNTYYDGWRHIGIFPYWTENEVKQYEAIREGKA